jgi:DNA-directed RNA polymerase specialized sigma24 family protein
MRQRLGGERPLAAAAAPIADSGLAEALATLSTADREALMLMAWEGLNHPSLDPMEAMR